MCVYVYEGWCTGHEGGGRRVAAAADVHRAEQRRGRPPATKLAGSSAMWIACLFLSFLFYHVSLSIIISPDVVTR